MEGFDRPVPPIPPPMCQSPPALQEPPPPPQEALKINSMIIKGVINTRFAETTIESSVKNSYDVIREAKIDVLLPMDAFVTKFTMNVDGKLIVGKVDEKKKADQLYSKAKQSGVTAGKVASREKSQRDFSQSMLAAPGETIVFNVTYQQLLYRYNSSYNYSVILNPNQAIDELSIGVHIVEENQLKFVRTPGFNPKDLRFDALSIADEPPSGSLITFSYDRRECHVQYSPSVADQTATSPFGLNGAYTVLYDVTEVDAHGSIIIQNGYFTHFFAARELPVCPKAVLYIMDVSGSMGGSKMSQACETLKLLINLHDEQDAFNVIFFSTSTRVWKNKELLEATSENKKNAIDFVNAYGRAGGGTNIHLAYETGFDTFQEYLDLTPEEKSTMDKPTLERANLRKEQLKNHWKMICFLTDGQHNSGGTSNLGIAHMIQIKNKGRVHIHNVAFGHDADLRFLQQISAENKGVTRRIFDNMNATASIKDFFHEVTDVLMTNVQIEYDQAEVEVTSQDYITKGREVIICGKIDEEKINSENGDYKISGKLTGRGSSADLSENFEIDPFRARRIDDSEYKIEQFTERILAYLKIKKLLEQVKVETNRQVVKTTNDQALQLSLRYNFVTPLTSIVVLKDTDREKILNQIEDEMDDEEPVTERCSSMARMNFAYSMPPPTSNIQDQSVSIVAPCMASTVQRKSMRPSLLISSATSSRCLPPPPPMRFYTSMSNSMLASEDSMRVELASRRDPQTSFSSEDCYSSEGALPTLASRSAGAPVERHENNQTKTYLQKLIALKAIRKQQNGKQPSKKQPWKLPKMVRSEPDVVICLKPDVNLSFNWEGQDHQVQNLIFHTKTKVTVNGLMIGARNMVNSSGKTRFFVNSMSFIIPSSTTNISITTKNIVISSLGMDDLLIPLTCTYSCLRHGIKLDVCEVLTDVVKLQLLIDGVEYKLRIHMKKDGEEYMELVDFTLVNGDSGKVDGVIGQYYGKDVSLVSKSDQDAILKVEYNLIEVKKSNQMTTNKSDCDWFAENGGLPISGGDKNRFVLPSLESLPNYE